MLQVFARSISNFLKVCILLIYSCLSIFFLFNSFSFNLISSKKVIFLFSNSFGSIQNSFRVFCIFSFFALSLSFLNLSISYNFCVFCNKLRASLLLGKS